MREVKNFFFLGGEGADIICNNIIARVDALLLLIIHHHTSRRHLLGTMSAPSHARRWRYPEVTYDVWAGQQRKS
jgi:hypothetical protein